MKLIRTGGRVDGCLVLGDSLRDHLASRDASTRNPKAASRMLSGLFYFQGFIKMELISHWTKMKMEEIVFSSDALIEKLTCIDSKDA